LCVQYLAPIVKNRQYNFLPLGFNPFVGPSVRPNEVTYSEDYLRPNYVPPLAPAPPNAPPPPANASTPAPMAAEAPRPAGSPGPVAAPTDPGAGLPGLMTPPPQVP